MPKRRWFRCPGIPFLAALLFVISGCSRANERHQAAAADPQAHAETVTVCLERLLVDLPGAVEMGATEASFDSGFGFDGINDNVISTSSPRWGATKIYETVPTDLAGYEKVRGGAEGELTEARYQYAAAVRGGPKEIKEWEEELARNRDEQTRSILNDKKKNLERARFGLKVSGMARLADAHAFAVRTELDYNIVFWDEADRRVRLFKGSLQHPEVGSPKAAADEYAYLRRVYRRRLPTEIPAGPGFCTPYGFLDESAGRPAETSVELPFRLERYPNLLFVLSVAPATPDRSGNVQKLPAMGVYQGSQLSLVDAKNLHGPVAVDILGSPGRLLELEHTPNCYESDCRPADVAYEMEATTFGEVGRLDRPAVTLVMKAVIADDYRLKARFDPSGPYSAKQVEEYRKLRRPALVGHQPPSYEEGKVIFEQTLKTLRLRPGAIVGAPVYEPAASKPVALR